MGDERIPMDTGDAVIVDGLGARAVRLEPSGDVALILDLEGKLNKLDIRDAHRYVLSAGIAAELIAEIIVTAQLAAQHGSALGITGGREFSVELEAAIGAEQRRRGLIRG